jgi:hypothetical protein
LGGLAGVATLSAQSGGGSGSNTKLTKWSTGTQILPGNGTVTPTGAGTLTQTGGGTLTLTAGGGAVSSIRYGTGNYPHLQKALVHLATAAQELNLARNDDKADYRDRAVVGVQMAIADVKRSIDHADQKSVPPVASLPALPEGLGNPQSNLVVPPLENPKISAPHMVAAIEELAGALRELRATTNGDPATGVGVKGDYLPRAIADVTFAIENSKAAINRVNGAPAEVQKASTPPAVAAPPEQEVNFLLIELSVGGLTVVVCALGAVGLRLRKGAGKPAFGRKQVPGV